MMAAWRWLIGRGWLPASWVTPAFAAAAWMPWVSMTIGIVAAVALVSLLPARSAGADAVEMYGPIALAIAVASVSVGADRKVERHGLLFQNPGSYSGHYLRGYAIGLAIIVVATAAVWTASQVGRGSLPVGWLVGALGFCVCTYAFACLAGAFLSRGNAALTIVWVAVPVLTAITFRDPAQDSLRKAIEAWFVPLNAIATLQGAIDTRAWTSWNWRLGAQLAGFPLACFALCVMRLRALDRAGFR